MSSKGKAIKRKSRELASVSLLVSLISMLKYEHGTERTEVGVKSPEHALVPALGNPTFDREPRDKSP